MDTPICQRSLELFYEVIDPADSGIGDAVTVVKTGTISINAEPDTDEVTATFENFEIDGEPLEENPDDPQTIDIAEPGNFSVKVKVSSLDVDNSEYLVRLLIEGVPNGVSVVDATQIGENSWLLIDEEALNSGSAIATVESIVVNGAKTGNENITLTAIAKDRGNDTTSAAAVESDPVQFTLNLTGSNTEDTEPTITLIQTPEEEEEEEGEEGEENDLFKNEDEEFTLSDVITASFGDIKNGTGYTISIAVTGLPEGTELKYMTAPTSDGAPT